MANPAAHLRKHCGHKHYHLTCEEFGALERDSAGQCGICGAHRGDRLYTDHDHLVGARAVRGLVCPTCNILLGKIDGGRREPDAAVIRYLTAPWYQRAGLDGACPPHCWNNEHAVYLGLAQRRAVAR